MNQKLSLFLILVTYLLAGCSQYRDRNCNPESLSDLVWNFENPPAEYSTAPFMVWNGNVTREKIDRQLGEFAEVGIKQAFIHPRWGMITPYLDSSWFDLVAYTVAKGKQMGMKIWLYDENAFPSGFAGGQVQLAMPASYRNPVGLAMRELQSPDTTLARQSHVILYRKDGQYTNITENWCELADKKGTFVYFIGVVPAAESNYGGFPYVDLLMPGVTDTFLALTMTGYENKFGKEFGKVVPGVFTDEPNIRPPQGTVRYTPDLFAQFASKYGYRLEEKLPELFTETGNWKATRYDYYKLLLELFINRWAIPWYTYTSAKELAWTGHYWEHGWPDPSHNPDNMAFYQYHQMPGIDMLFNNRELQPDQFGNIRAVKELASVANQMGYRRTLSETYGASGYDLTFADMKRNGDWQYALGVNFMNQHLAYMDIVGDRKHDFPQTFSAHNPWWKHYKIQADYFARLSLALSFGEQVNHTLVIEPTTTTWMYYSPLQPSDTLKQIKRTFDELLGGLELNHVEYDLATENMLPSHGKVTRDGLRINKRTYRMVVLPHHFANLDSATFRLLDEYVRQGNKLLAFSVPATLNGRPFEGCRKWFDEFPSAVKLIQQADTTLLYTLADKDFSISPAAQSAGELYHIRRQLDGGQIVFMANFSPNQSSKGDIRLQGKYLYILDPATGILSQYPAIASAGSLHATFDIPVTGSLLLLATNRRIRGAGLHSKPMEPADTTYLTGKIETKRKGLNVLVLDYCRLISGNNNRGEMHTFDVTNRLFRDHGYSSNPWSVGVQVGQKWIESDTFGSQTAFEVQYAYTVARTYGNARPLRLAVEQPHLYEISVNGQSVKEQGEWWLDPEIGLLDISSATRAGTNTITLRREAMSVYAEIEPVYILGDFVLHSAPSGFVIDNELQPLAMGSWARQGYPFYFNPVSYIGYFKTTDNQSNYILQCPEWEGVVAEVMVNGKSAGCIETSPGQLDLSEYLRAGNNSVEVIVYGSLKNVLGPFHQNYVKGLVTPWSWHFAPSARPSGANYRVMNYGLSEDFYLLKYPQPVNYK